MLYIIAYIVLSYQIPQENSGKFSYKLDMEIIFILFFLFWILTDHNLTTSNWTNSENGKTTVTDISRVKSKKM
jgi:hypothetical protein